MARDARWRTWDLDCLQQTLVSRQQHENEIEPLIVPGCTREITSLNLGSIVLPKEAFSTSNDAGARLRARGRGRSLTNRALGIDKPSRRPGENDISHKAGNPTVDNPKPTTLGSQFFGSRCLYEELFPSLDQSCTKKSDPSLPIPSVWSGKQKSKKGQQNNEQATNNKSSFLEKSTTDKFKSKQSDGHDNSTNNGKKKFTSFSENSREILEQSHVDSDTNRDETKLPSSTFYNCANDVVTSVKKFVETKDKSRSDQVNVSEIPMNDKHVTAKTPDTNAGENYSQFNTVGFGRIEAISSESDWQSDEEEFGPIENKISLQSSSLENMNSVDCLITTESEELDKDEQSEKLNMLSHKLVIDDHQNSNPKDYVQEIEWIDSENNDKFSEQCNNDWRSDEDEFGPIENKISLVDCLITTESEELHKDEQSEPLNMLSHKLEIDDHQNSNPKDYVQEIEWIDSENNDKFSEQCNNDWQSDEDEFGPIENKISLVDCLITTESEELHKDEQSEPLNMLSHKLEIDDHQNSYPKDYVQEIQWIDSENDKFSEQCNDKVNICDQMSDCLEVEDDQNSTSLKDVNFQEADWIESKDNLLFQKYGKDEISNHLLDQLRLEGNPNPKDYFQDIDSVQNDNSSHSCDQLSAISNEKSLVCDKTKHLEISDSYEQLSTNGHLSPDQDAKADHTQPIEGSSTIISTSTNHLLSQSDSEGQECIETKENLEESLNMSSSDVEMEPCNVLLENLPLALTEEELQEIIEPYGEMESYNFNINDDSSKTCTVRMPNSMSGELLVVSLDGLEVDGYRIKAQMDDS